ncbi:centromere protein U [Esox lucius]|uniref:Centromere protein U n=1 Tax=Esox lucius TaxID=8010 RepID=A0A3P8Y7C7_ESOLU|nr:centromere protein U [Esox lucius]
MSKKSQITKVLQNLQKQLVEIDSSNGAQKSKPAASLCSPNVSTIGKASFLDLCDIYGNPLHSTALEEDFSPKSAQDQEAAANEGEANGRGGPSKKVHSETPKIPTQAGRGQTKRKSSRVVVPKESSPKKNGQNKLGVKPKTRPQKKSARVKGGEDLTRAQSETSAPQKQALDTNEDDSESANEEDCDNAMSALGCGPQPVQRKRRAWLSSEDLTDEDVSWSPSKKKASQVYQGKQRKSSVMVPRRSLQGPRRKSSSGSLGSSGPSQRDKPRQRNVKKPIDLDVVLDSFLEFVSEYFDTLDSNAVKQAINALSSSFEDQLTEIITDSKELKVLKTENAKMNAAINQKRARLLEAKNELIRSEIQLRALQKDQSQLEQRLTDIRKGTTFLKDLSHLHKSYLDHREAHPDQVEEYGPSSLPALLLEARGVLGTEDQLKTVNERLQKALDRLPS